MGAPDPVDVVANVATGGLYGAGQAAYDVASGKQDVLSGLTSGANQLGPYGAAVYPVSPTAATVGNLIGAGAGIGGGGLGGGGFGTAGSAGGGAVDLGPGAMVGVTDAGEPLYLIKTAAGVSTMTAGEAAAAGIPTMTAVGLGAGALTGGGGATGAALGGAVGQQLGQQFLGQIGSPFTATPVGGGYTGGTGQLTPQQLAALSAMQSEQHRGLAPTFEQRMKGQPVSPGIAGSNYLG